MLWLPPCATSILSPDGENVTEFGLMNFPSPVPCDPNVKSGEPSAA